MNLSSPQDALLARLLEASSLRYKVISNNISNQNTPGFKRQYVKFESLVKEALNSSGGNLDNVAPEVVIDESPGRGDGNNVVLETEQNALKENQLLYDAYAAIMRGRMEMLRTAILGDR